MENPVVAASSSPTTSAKKEDFVSACRQGDLAAVDRLISEARAHSTETLREMVDSGDQDSWTPLLFTCFDGHDAVMVRLLAAGVNIEQPLENGVTPFYLACQNGHQEVVKRLLAAGANINAPSNDGVSPLFMACQNDHLEVVKRLLAAGANIDAPNKNGTTPLFMACQNGHQEVVERLLAAGANIDAPTNTGATPLFMACQNDHQEVVKTMLAAGANKEAAKNNGTTPLAIAALKGHLPVVKQLLGAGANIETLDEKGWSPLFCAASKGHVEVVEKLLAAGANIDTPNKNGTTPLFITCQNGHLKVVERLLAAGANITTPKNTGTTPLFISCQKGYLAVVERLLAAGANTDVPDNEDATPLYVTCQNGHLEVVARLMAAGACIDTPANDGSTPLNLACLDGHQEVVERLLAAGAHIDIPMNDGITPLHRACFRGHLSVVELLLSAGANPSAIYMGFNPADLARENNHPEIVSLLSQPLPVATVAAHQRRILKIKVKLTEAKARYSRVKQPSKIELTAAKTHAEQEAAIAKQLLLQKEAELSEARKREDQLRVEQERMNEMTKKEELAEQHRVSQLLAAAELSHFNVEQSQLDVDVVPFAKGGNGSIHRGRYHGTAVAVKYLSEDLPELYKKEVRMWCKLRHPNVLQLLGLSLDISRPMIVMELMERSLFDVLHDPKVLLEWGQRVEMAHGVAAGLSYIHALKAVHRDIKSLNILVRGREVKIADFGSTRGQKSLEHTRSEAGTPAWLAPELFSNAPPTPKVDVYAFGVVMFELASREIPWRGCVPAAIMRSVLAGDRPQVNLNILKEAAGPQFAKLMQRCWNQKVWERPTSAEVLRDLTSILGVGHSSTSSPALQKPPAQPMYGSFGSNFSPKASPSRPLPAAPIPLPKYGFQFDRLTIPVAGPSSPLAACSSTDWSVEAWLASLGLSKYIPIFREHELFTPELIKRLDLIELKEEIGIAAYGARKQIFDAAKLL